MQHTPRQGNISIYNFSVRLDLIIQYQEEDRNESFDEMCLFCSQKFAGGREACIEFFRHMNNTHQFNIGHPDNMVSVMLTICLYYIFLRKFRTRTQTLTLIRESWEKNPKRGTVTERVLRKKIQSAALHHFVYFPILWIVLSGNRAR